MNEWINKEHQVQWRASSIIPKGTSRFRVGPEEITFHLNGRFVTWEVFQENGVDCYIHAQSTSIIENIPAFFTFEISNGSKEIEWEYLERKSIYWI